MNDTQKTPEHVAGLNYLQQGQWGRSNWWVWIFVTYLTLIGWVVFQTFLVAPIPAVAGLVDPEIAQEYEALATALWADVDVETHGQYSGLMMLSTLAALLGIASTLLMKGAAKRIALGFALLAMGLSIFFGIQSNGMIDGQPLMDLMSLAMGASPIAFAMFLLTFPTALIALYLCQKFIHKRTIRSLHTAASRIHWGWMVQGFVVTVLILGGFAFIGSLLGLVELRYVFDDARFWGFAIVSLALIPFQAATEEIVFRGYFNQALTHILRNNKWIAFFVTSFGFMALHLSNPEALSAVDGALPIVMSGYFLFGFAACLLVLFDDGLETAIGVHAGNNCFAAIVVNYENSVLPTPSIFLTGTDPVKDAISTIIVLAVIVAIFAWLRRGRVRSGGTPSSLAA